MIIEFELNGRLIKSEIDPGKTLLEYLRSEEIYSVKHGCDHGECGACTVLINDKAMNACLILMPMVEGKKVETVESFSDHEHLHELQESFLAEGAAQCGFCTPGMIMSATALLMENPQPTEEEIRIAISGNLCRCTGYVQIIEAIQATVDETKA